MRVKTILLPRTPKQEAEIRQAKPGLFESGRIIVPKRALNGLDLIWRSDLVISGGGTMNREAAALGVPVYSLFRGSARCRRQASGRDRQADLIAE